MKLPDVNILLTAVDEAAALHRPARVALEAAFNSAGGVAMAWITLLGFIRLSTKVGIFPNPLNLHQALELIRQWTDHPECQIVHPTESHLEVIGRLLIGAGQAGDLTTDAHLAALAIEHGAELLSFDRDFARFPGLRWVNPAK